ncbi:MAG: NAD-dependent DNA ligase LigA [Bacteroides sp.]|nr:NAD-dependent DNA ligase LigA [Bacteroides sp.]MCM1550683.1 NAD-dependent DNA ligase LigA [Clostridium sp.]
MGQLEQLEQLERMKELVMCLNQAGRAYYQEDREIMSNREYDALYDELVHLEVKTGITLANSPTQHVGYEVLSELAKEEHSTPMLSLDKTKDVETLADWLGDKQGVLSWKMDGLTVVLTYRNGVLAKAVTRGNGEIGEVITNNARTFRNIPNRIPYTGELVVRGEAVIKYSDFERINATIEDVEAKYKNPRNLCSGTVRQLNNQITAERNVHFFAFHLVEGTNVEYPNSIAQRFRWLTKLGFDVVEYELVTGDTIREAVQGFSNRIRENDFPSDGLVLTYDDAAYGKSLGVTAKFPRNSIAFKWADELAVTHLRYIEWSPSRTGLINPVAVFDPVELEGTSVSRASMHNISILESFQMGEGDEISVFKANMIIPQVAENQTRSGTILIPEHCPACGAPTEIRQENDVKSLYCTNGFCSAKKLKLFSHFVSRNAMNIDGLSEATIEKFMEEGFLVDLYDLYRLEPYRMQIVVLDGFGERSYENLQDAIEASRLTTLSRFLYGLGIINVGAATAKLICRHFRNDLTAIRNAGVEELMEIEGIGAVIAESVVAYFENEGNQERIRELLKEIRFEQEEAEVGNQIFQGMNFVITGSLHHYANRDAMKGQIEALGGKVTGSVTSKTHYLINNDVTSNSSKNKKAKELRVPIISEDTFIEMLNGKD